MSSLTNTSIACAPSCICKHPCGHVPFFGELICTFGAVFDYQFTNSDGFILNKIVFISWCAAAVH